MNFMKLRIVTWPTVNLSAFNAFQQLFLQVFRIYVILKSEKPNKASKV